jgi:hypothetical protein
MEVRKLRDAAEEIVEDLAAWDRNRPERNSIEDRTGAELMLRDGCSDQEITDRYGNVPTPIERRSMGQRPLREAAESLLEGLDERDRNRPERDSIEDRTGASVMRDSGVPEETITRLYGYSPMPLKS